MLARKKIKIFLHNLGKQINLWCIRDVGVPVCTVMGQKTEIFGGAIFAGLKRDCLNQQQSITVDESEFIY